MKWPLGKRTPNEKRHDAAEAAALEQQLKWAMDELRSCLDKVEYELEKGQGRGRDR